MVSGAQSRPRGLKMIKARAVYFIYLSCYGFIYLFIIVRDGTSSLAFLLSSPCLLLFSLAVSLLGPLPGPFPHLICIRGVKLARIL